LPGVANFIFLTNLRREKMALKIRLARRGNTHRPFYHIVVADARAPRDGEYIEKLGFYNPLAKEGTQEQRLVLDTEAAKAWVAKGAQPTDRVAKFLGQLGAAAMPKITTKPIQSAPKKKAQARLDDIAKAAAAAKEAEEAAKEAAAAPAAEEAAAE
jgi:small subunit ribosomal protein S16